MLCGGVGWGLWESIPHKYKTWWCRKVFAPTFSHLRGDAVMWAWGACCCSRLPPTTMRRQVNFRDWHMVWFCRVSGKTVNRLLSNPLTRPTLCPGGWPHTPRQLTSLPVTPVSGKCEKRSERDRNIGMFLPLPPFSRLPYLEWQHPILPEHICWGPPLLLGSGNMTSFSLLLDLEIPTAPGLYYQWPSEFLWPWSCLLKQFFISSPHNWLSLNLLLYIIKYIYALLHFKSARSSPNRLTQLSLQPVGKQAFKLIIIKFYLHKGWRCQSKSPRSSLIGNHHTPLLRQLREPMHSIWN